MQVAVSMNSWVLKACCYSTWWLQSYWLPPSHPCQPYRLRFDVRGGWIQGSLAERSKIFAWLLSQWNAFSPKGLEEVLVNCDWPWHIWQALPQRKKICVAATGCLYIYIYYLIISGLEQGQVTLLCHALSYFAGGLRFEINIWIARVAW